MPRGASAEFYELTPRPSFAESGGGIYGLDGVPNDFPPWARKRRVATRLNSGGTKGERVQGGEGWFGLGFSPRGKWRNPARPPFPKIPQNLTNCPQQGKNHPAEMKKPPGRRGPVGNDTHRSFCH